MKTQAHTFTQTRARLLYTTLIYHKVSKITITNSLTHTHSRTFVPLHKHKLVYIHNLTHSVTFAYCFRKKYLNAYPYSPPQTFLHTLRFAHKAPHCHPHTHKHAHANSYIWTKWFRGDPWKVFFHWVVAIWNLLPEKIMEKSTFTAFKKENWWTVEWLRHNQLPTKY